MCTHLKRLLNNVLNCCDKLNYQSTDNYSTNIMFNVYHQMCVMLLIQSDCQTAICELLERKNWAQTNNKPHHTQGLIPSICDQLSQIVWPLILLIPLGKLMWLRTERWVRQKCRMTDPFTLIFLSKAAWKYSPKKYKCIQLNVLYGKKQPVVCIMDLTVIYLTPCRQQAKITCD